MYLLSGESAGGVRASGGSARGSDCGDDGSSESYFGKDRFDDSCDGDEDCGDLVMIVLVIVRVESMVLVTVKMESMVLMNLTLESMVLINPMVKSMVLAGESDRKSDDHN